MQMKRENKIKSTVNDLDTWLQLICCAVCLPHGRNFR